MAEIQFPNWINKSDGAAQSPEEMNKLVNVIQNHAENLSLQQKQILASAGGIYPEKINPSSTFPDNISQAIFLVGPGTYTNFGNKTIPTNNLGLIFYYNSTFELSLISIPSYDDTNLVNRITSAEDKVDNFIENYQELPNEWFNFSSEEVVFLDFSLSSGQVLTGGTINTSTNWLRATVNNINGINKLYIEGLGDFILSSVQPPYTRVAFYNNNTLLNYIAWVDGVNDLEINIPTNTTKLEIQVAGGSGVGLNPSTSPYLNQLKVFKKIGNPNDKLSIKSEYIDGALTKKDLSNKYLHFSFDDVVLSLKDLTTNQSTYTSIFNNVFFAELKRLHDTYGAVFSLYCFTETTGWDFSNFPTKYAQEIRDNSDWLKFGFHTKNTSTNYQSATASAIKADYDYFINQFYAKTQSINAIDRVVRLQNFLGNLDAIKSIRDTNCGILGLLTADDTRVSYYLNSEQVAYINSHDSFTDSDNFLKLFKTEQRLEGVSNINTYLANFLTPQYANQSKELILFTHEIELYSTAGGSLNNTMKSKIESCLNWAKTNKYSFDFPRL
ncbi:hypothetical protein [Faecalibacter sp. LW9]|uniref:hypothetical protein n=1 Tax=Faecalibacter sp. LW9 TaxID=3103144 RepID=UPI002AFFE3A2|nr:hypothetical protein [Faecalibacter sp. LW9]